MYTYLIFGGLIAITMCLLFKYTNFKNLFTKQEDCWPDEEIQKLQHRKDEVVTEEPGVTNNSLITILKYFDKKEDSRTNYKNSQHSLTNFFLFIIAFYCVVQLIKECISFGLIYEVVGSLPETLQQLWLH